MTLTKLEQTRYTDRGAREITTMGVPDHIFSQSCGKACLQDKLGAECS